MNETIQLLNGRKSVRAYAPGPLAPDVKAAILNAALQAPTAGSMTLYTILDITDPALKTRLSETCDHQPFIATAPLGLIFCADYHRWFSLFAQDDTATRRPGEGDLVLAMADALIAAQSAVIAGESLGVGSCYIGDILEQYETHRELLHLPAHVLPVAMVCFGIPTDTQRKRKIGPKTLLSFSSSGYGRKVAVIVMSRFTLTFGSPGSTRRPLLSTQPRNSASSRSVLPS